MHTFITKDSRLLYFKMSFFFGQGIVVFGITVYAQALVIREKGPVFTTAFRPSSMVIVAIMGLLILGEEMHLGEYVFDSFIIPITKFESFIIPITKLK